MNAKERVLATIEGRIPDRVPIGEFAVDFDTAQKILGHETYLRAKAKSKIAFWEGRHEEVAESYLRDHIELHEKLDLDIVMFVDATYPIPMPTDDPPPRKVDDSTWEDKYGRVYKYSEITADITCVHDPVEEARQYSVEDFERPPAPPEINPLSLKIIDAVTRRFKDEKFICSPGGEEVGIVLLGGLERGLMRLIEQPDVVRAATRFELAQQALADETLIHPDADAVLWGQDFGYNAGPFINPEMFRDFFLEANKARTAHVHERYGKKVVKHACGNNNPLMDFFLEIGYDVYQSIQPTAGMDICEVKRAYGDRIALWGGVGVEKLVGGTPEDVRADVRRAMECAKPGGRFILGTSHSVAVGTKYDNYMAMLDEYHKLCDY